MISSKQENCKHSTKWNSKTLFFCCSLFHGTFLGTDGLLHSQRNTAHVIGTVCGRLEWYSLSCWKLLLSPCRSLSIVLALFAGWVSSCVEEPGDWQLHMCLCNYGRANWQRGTLGNCYYWHTRTTPYTHRWTQRLPSSQREAWSDEGEECLCECAHRKEVKRDESKAVKRIEDSLCRPVIVCFIWGWCWK